MKFYPRITMTHNHAFYLIRTSPDIQHFHLQLHLFLAKSLIQNYQCMMLHQHNTVSHVRAFNFYTFSLHSDPHSYRILLFHRFNTQNVKNQQTVIYLINPLLINQQQDHLLSCPSHQSLTLIGSKSPQPKMKTLSLDQCGFRISLKQLNVLEQVR